MADVAVAFLLENLRNLLVDETNLVSGVNSELNQLSDELQLMKAFLQDSEKKREKGEAWRQFERDIRDAVYEAEDIIDAYVTHAAAKSVFTRAFNPNQLILAKTMRAFRKEKLQPLLEGATKLASENASGTSAQEEPRTQHPRFSPVREDNVVGFEDEKETLIKYLIKNEESEELDVISIMGMPGVGKTTLALKIYRDPRIRFVFTYLIWVYASQPLNMRDVCLTILSEFTPEDISGLPDSLLADIIRNNLENRRFLMVIDDVHTTEDWRTIEAALPKSNRLGKVLVTTRDKRVAKEANRNREPQILRFLNIDESWELLQLRVFGKNNGCPPELERVGRKIAEQCSGLPLAVVVIAGILRKGVHRNIWERVLMNSVSTYLQDGTHELMENFMSLSYNNLPHHLRDCFLYLGMFPQDTEIPVWKLTRLWIAEGFIKHNPGKSLEEAAEDNLNDLVARNLVMVEKTKANGDVKTCRVHDMIREFCKNEAGFANKNLFQEVKKTGQGVFDPPISEIGKCRRLSIHSHVEEFLRTRAKGPKVRSFLCFSKETVNLPTGCIPSITEAFDLLRIIDVNPINFTEFPLKLTKLMHLRYIALSGNEFRALPNAVSKLWNLQTIKIDTASHQFEIRADISKMMQLRHLKTKAAIVLNKGAKGKGGEKLQTLSRLSTKSLTNDIIDRAVNLKNLGIRGQLNTLVNTTYLARLDRLKKLKLVHDVFPNTTSENPLIGLPRPEAFPPNLRILELTSTSLEWKHMSTLGMLLTLEVLKLKANAFMGRLWEVDDENNFPSLEVLQIDHTDLEVWTASGDSFSRLRCLVLKNCERLQEIPHVLVRSLQVVDIERVNKSAVESARRIEMEKQQMKDQRKATSSGFKLVIAPGDEP